MWFHTSTLVFSLLVNVLVTSASIEELDADLKSSVLSRLSTWECTSNDYCTASNSSCIDGYCICDSGYIYNTDSTECILAATAYGDPCTETLQCSVYLLTGSVCEAGVCICGEGFHYIHGRCYQTSGLGEPCSADVLCYVNADNEATSCINGVCECSNGFYKREYRTCRRIGYAEGDDCAIDQDCQFTNGFCDNSTYLCATYNTTRTRLPETIEEDDRVERSLNRADGDVTVGTLCTSNDNCTSLANSRCGPAGTCICSRAYYPSSDLSACLPEIGEECNADDPVDIRFSTCRNGTWSCSYSRVASLDQKFCRKSTKHYDWSCLWDEQCYILGPDSSCQNKRCLCNEKSHYVEEERFCWVSRGIGESCQADRDCYVENINVELSCDNSVCSCPDGMAPNYDSTLCKSVEAQLGDICEENADCAVPHSACIDSVCACPDNYFEVDEVCKIGINAICSSDSDCDVENSTCTSSNTCACLDNFVAVSTNSCLQYADHGEECFSDYQCSVVLNNTYCAVDEESGSSSCQCDSNYHYSFGSCYLRRSIGDSCTTLAQCFVEDGIENVVCRNGECACSWDTTANSTTACVVDRSDATTAAFFLATWLGPLLLFSVKTFSI